MGLPIIGDLINSVVNKVGGVASELIVDKDKKLQLQADLERIRLEALNTAAAQAHDEMMGQIEVNKIEAGNESIFVSGWRPAVGWIGATGLAYSFVLEPVGAFLARVVFKYSGNFPALDTASLMVLVTGMLGFGGLRTYEKQQGVAGSPPDNGGRTDGIPVEQINMDPRTGRIRGTVPPKVTPWMR